VVKYAKINAFDVFNYFFMAFLALIFIIPFWSTIVTSVVSNAERVRRGMFIFYPEKFDWSAYNAILKRGSEIYSGYRITLFRTLFGTVCSMFVTVLMSYGLSKRDLPGRNMITFLVYFTMLFSGGLVPTFLIVKFTGLYNNLLAYIIPGLVSAWNMLLMRNFFMQVPDDLEEASIIDGASPPTVLFRIVLPLSVPSLVTIALFYAVGQWNAWFDAVIYINDRNKLPLQTILRNLIVASRIELITDMFTEAPPPLESVKGATIIVSTLPIMLLYPFLQKYFVKGVMIGSLKG